MTVQLQIENRCVTSWQARPGSFVGLMSVYESNFVLLRALLGDAHCLPDAMTSVAPSDSPLILTMEERGPYTTTFRLTYRFDDGGVQVSDPDMQIRVYRDAGLAEALSCAQWHKHPIFSGWQTPAVRDARPDMRARWRRNMMLNKWLDYCVERGHIFGPR